MTMRKNPKYPPWYCMTVVKCSKCGEMFEPICELKHICKEQNSYPESIEQKRPANKSQGVKRKFHKTFTEEKMDTTIRPPKRSEKNLSRPATLTEHHKNAVVVVPTVRNS